MTRITCITPGMGALSTDTCLPSASCRRPARLGHPVDTQRMGDLGATHSGNVIADPPEADRNQGDGTGDEDRGLAPLERPVTT